VANLALENPKFGAEGLEILPLEADMKFVHKLLYQKYLEILVRFWCKEEKRPMLPPLNTPMFRLGLQLLHGSLYFGPLGPSMWLCVYIMFAVGMKMRGHVTSSRCRLSIRQPGVLYVNLPVRFAVMPWWMFPAADAFVYAAANSLLIVPNSDRRGDIVGMLLLRGSRGQNRRDKRTTV